MASSLINNAIQIYFDSVYGMADEGMVHMFKALESSGLRGFLGCSSAIYKAALVEFFQNASVRDNKFVSAVQGKAVEITEEVFAGTFELPTEGLTEMTDVPKDLVFDARIAFPMGGEQLKTSCKKREMNFEFRLLNDILAKTVTVKAGSFDAVTHRGPSSITARWSSDTTNQSVTTPIIALDLSGTKHLSVGHNVALSQSLSIQPRCSCKHKSQSTYIMPQNTNTLMLKAVNKSSTRTSALKFYLNRSYSGTTTSVCSIGFLAGLNNHSSNYLKNLEEPKNARVRSLEKLRTNRLFTLLL
ncbi:histone-lysine N-methyltransferase 2D-like [Dorcoceras hygrometricum]|uniref:Histone-lysine N-methyltransferase 2D-like n=1 Tax=Dorcoceras hygrometricum TaxID=472368 RepID=A0A2Z7BRC0_9LAMI|nr:histone-lysine N-methyltransferase 2D-like [Dorcoceras hygrometricum]